MGFKPDWPIIDPAKLTDDLGTWREGLAKPLQKFMTTMRAMTSGGLTINDNMQATIVSYPLVHGVELPFKSPSFRPRGFTVLSSLDEAGNEALPVNNVQINYNRSDAKQGWFGLTANYALPVGEDMTVALLANQSLANNTRTPIVWGGVVAGATAPSKPGDALSWNGTDGINLLKAGVYRLTGMGAIAANATGVRQAFISLNSTYLAFQGYSPAPATDATVINLSLDFITPGGEGAATLSLNQASGGALNALGGGALSNRVAGGFARCWLQATRIRNDETYSANVTGILWGG